MRSTDELVVDQLWALGAIAVTEHDDCVQAGFATLDDEQRAIAALHGRVRLEQLADDTDAWADTWRGAVAPTRVGRFVLQPAWLREDTPGADDDGDALVIRIDPGRAFGIGSHATTRLAIEALVEEVSAGDSVLDVGTGTGVLALVAIRAGAALVSGIDVDPGAIAVASENARMNGCSDHVSLSTTALEDVDGTFDVVVANLGGLLTPVALAPHLAARAARAVVVSGLLDPNGSVGGPQPRPLDDAMRAHGFELGRAAAAEGWMARTYVSRAGTPARPDRGSPATTAPA